MSHTRSIGAVLVVLVALGAGGCERPDECVETYPPLLKLVLGLPIPLLVMLALSVAMTSWIDRLRLQPKRLRYPALAAVVVACTVPSIFVQLVPEAPGDIGGVLAVAVLAVAVLAVPVLTLRG